MRRIAVALVVAAAVAAVAIWFAFLRDPGPGPLADTGGGVFGMDALPGQIASMDYQLRKPLSVPAVLLGIRLLHPAEGRGLAFRYAARTNAAGGAVGSGGWRLRAWHARPLAGFVIPAHQYGSLVVGMSASQPGVHHIRGFILTYRVGDTTYNGPLEDGIDLRVRKKR
ncbi:MAG TPA: hypothetical protein VGH79_10380 [Gaiellaceae bacterium]|jgi:hypothetical protein